MEGLIIKAPARNYHGYVMAQVTGFTLNSRGRVVVMVKALKGEPWDDAGFFGSSSTNKARFSQEALAKLNETAPIAVEAVPVEHQIF